MRSRPKRLERATEQHFSVIVCPNCGEAFRDVGDLPLRVLVAECQDTTGEDRESDPVVDSILSHPCEGLTDAVLSSFPGARHAG